MGVSWIVGESAYFPHFRLQRADNQRPVCHQSVTGGRHTSAIMSEPLNAPEIPLSADDALMDRIHRDLIDGYDEELFPRAVPPAG
jgi:hypothetical protein